MPPLLPGTQRDIGAGGSRKFLGVISWLESAPGHHRRLVRSSGELISFALFSYLFASIFCSTFYFNSQSSKETWLSCSK